MASDNGVLGVSEEGVAELAYSAVGFGALLIDAGDGFFRQHFAAVLTLGGSAFARGFLASTSTAALLGLALAIFR